MDCHKNLLALIDDLCIEYGPDYVMAALKQINDQQMLHLSFKGCRIPDDPILKVYEQVVGELEAVLFERHGQILKESDLKRIVDAARRHTAAK
ncbi:MAG TPA: hypothetical protein PLV45_05935 [bacterium]|nr:hypothetical protein [bacterium]